MPDAIDAANKNFMFGQLPYVFGSGCCFITGTNVMVRTNAVFRCSRFFDSHRGELHASGPNGEPPQLLSEDEISEDVELGSRIHAAGYKVVLVPENLATGEVEYPQRQGCFEFKPGCCWPPAW
jgi:cellulose synthase/poly-beta-1,6-N-acetylglucosamine synthase-like glycosyltransferase